VIFDHPYNADFVRGPLPGGSGWRCWPGYGLPGGGRMGLVLVVLLLIPGVRLRNVPAGTEFGLERLTGLIILAMAAENSLRGAAPADPGDP
jgi:hypothetical protein